MKILLISLSPPKDINPVTMPLGLYYLKSCLIEEKEINQKIDIEIKEFSMLENTYKILKYVYRSEPDVIGFTCYAMNINKILDLCAKIKKILPDVNIVLGGPEVSPISEKILKENPSVDVVVRHEGEITFRELIKHYLFKRNKIDQISGLSFRKNGKIKINKERPMIKNLNDIPSPFLNNTFEMGGRDLIMFECSRGCYFNCHFCYYQRNYSGVRYFSLNRLKKEIKHILEFEPKILYPLEAAFGANKEMAYKICDVISKYNKETSVYAETHAETVNERLVNKFVEANFKIFDIGLQTTNRQTLKNINRPFNPERFKRGIRLLKKANLLTRIQLVIGLPGDNLKTFKKSVSWTCSLKPYRIEILILQVLPGTYLYNNAEKFDIKFEERGPHRIISNYTFSSEEIKKAISFGRKIMLTYNKPPLLFKNLYKILSQHSVRE